MRVFRKFQHTSLSDDLNVVFAVAATIEILAWWLKQSDPPSVSRMAEILDQLVVTPSIDGPVTRESTN